MDEFGGGGQDALKGRLSITVPGGENRGTDKWGLMELKKNIQTAWKFKKLKEKKPRRRGRRRARIKLRNDIGQLIYPDKKSGTGEGRKHCLQGWEEIGTIIVRRLIQKPEKK